MDNHWTHSEMIHHGHSPCFSFSFFFFFVLSNLFFFFVLSFFSFFFFSLLSSPAAKQVSLGGVRGEQRGGGGECKVLHGRSELTFEI